jgi:hypothetical protein
MPRALQWRVRRTGDGYRGIVSLAASSDGRARLTCGAVASSPTAALERAAAMAARAASELNVREDAASAADDLDAVCGFIPPAATAAAAQKALSIVKKLFSAIRARRRRKRAAAARRRAEQAQQAQQAPEPTTEPEVEAPEEEG